MFVYSIIAIALSLNACIDESINLTLQISIFIPKHDYLIIYTFKYYSFNESLSFYVVAHSPRRK